MELKAHQTDADIRPAGIMLYDISPMDYFSKTQTRLSKSSVFRAELWRRRHLQTNGNGGGSSAYGGYYNGARNGFNTQTNTGSCTDVDIETVLTRNMSQEDLKKLIEHQMVEAIKLVRFYSLRTDNGRNVGSFDDLVELVGLSEKRISTDLSVNRTPEFSSKKKRQPKSCKMAKQRGHDRRISL